MFEDGILVIKQSMTRQPKWSRDLQHSTLAPYWARQAVGEARFDQSVSQVKH